MQGSDPRPSNLPEPRADDARAAFQELHGPRLHGFALLLTLGDRVLAARLSADALSAGSTRVGELRHPERAAAWLRAHVVRGARFIDRRPIDVVVSELGLRPLGADEAVCAGLARLGRLERAALVAAIVERLDRRDVATIVGRDGRALAALLRQARGRYAAGHAERAVEEPAGRLFDRIRATAERALA